MSMQVDTLHPLEIPEAEIPVTVKNTGNVMVYYKADSTVSAASHDGSLPAGGSMALAGTTWFLAAAAGGQISFVTPAAAGTILWGLTNMSDAEAGEYTDDGVTLNRGLAALEPWASKDPTATLTEIAKQLALGVTPVVLIFGTQADEEAERKLSAWETAEFSSAAINFITEVEDVHPGAVIWELLNEPWAIYGGSDAADYARLIKPVLEGVPSTARVAIAAYGSYSRQNESFSAVQEGEGWLYDMLVEWGANPAFTGAALYWTCHPYGSPSVGAAAHYYRAGIRSVESLHSQAARLGLLHADDWLITEFGWKIVETVEAENEVKTAIEQAQYYEEALERLWGYMQSGWLHGVLPYRGSAVEGFGITGQPAGQIYRNFAAAHQRV